jgi:NADPH2:quinone reductase
MKAVLCKSLDGPDGLVLDDIAMPQPGAGEVRIRVKAAGLNFADTLITRGKYQLKPQMPFSPGVEIAGVIDELGPSVAGLANGTRVMAYTGFNGVREFVVVPSDAVVPVPDGVSDEVAAGLSVTYGTALHGLKDRGRLQGGETVVVTGAAGGAGQAAVEIAHLMGARVIAVAASPEKLQVAKEAGASETILFPGSDLKDAVKTLTKGKGADVVYDCVGGAAAEPLIRALAWKGRFLVVGFAAGQIPKIPLNLLLVKGAAVAGVYWGESVKRDPATHRENMLQLLEWVRTGQLRPRIHATFGIERTAEALRVLDRREAQGKVIVTL